LLAGGARPGCMYSMRIFYISAGDPVAIPLAFIGRFAANSAHRG
jgi:hypothetical protein